MNRQARGTTGGTTRGFTVGVAGLALAGVIGLVAGADRLPSLSMSVGGYSAEMGPGRRTVSLGAAPANASSGLREATDSSGQAAAPVGASYTFPTYEDTEEFAGKTLMHVLAPQWVPAGFIPQPLTVTLNALTPEAAAYAGRTQRVAVTQRFVASDGLFTLVQSMPPPVFDLMIDAGRPEDALPLANGLRVQYGQYPQGVILYWRERGDVRSVGIIGDQGAGARLTREDWQRLAESLA